MENTVLFQNCNSNSIQTPKKSASFGSSSFLLHKRQFSSPIMLGIPPTFKKSDTKKLNLHQLKIQAEDMCDQDEEQVKRQKAIIEGLKRNCDSESDEENSRKPIPLYKREFKMHTENRNNTSYIVKENYDSLFSQGFLPEVQKFYSNFKHIDREKDKNKVNMLRHTVHQSEAKRQNHNSLKLAENIQQNGIFPKKLGMVGRHSLHKLDQNNVHMTKKQMKALAQGLTLCDVKKLGLSNNKLSKENAKLLFQSLPQKLEKINLKNTFKTKDILLCLNSQKFQLGKLKKLNLSENNITDTGFSCIQQILKSNSNLQILNLSNNLITDVSSQFLAGFIECSSSIRNLNLSWNKISGRRVFPLFEAFASSVSLLNIDLSRNQIGDYLSEPIPKKFISKRKTQNQSNTRQGGEQSELTSLKAVCEFFKYNKYLLHLDVSYNRIKQQECQEISHVFNLFNESLVGLHFEGNSNYKMNSLGYLVSENSTEQKQTNKLVSKNTNLNMEDQTKKEKQDILKPKTGSQTKLFNKIDVNGLAERLQTAMLKEKKNLIQQKSSNLLKLKNMVNQQSHCDQCWMCQGWVTRKFVFQISQTKFKTLAFLDSLHQTAKSAHQNSLKNVYIHLQCYNYQPLLMKLKKSPRRTPKNHRFQQTQLKGVKGELNSLVKGTSRQYHEDLKKKKGFESFNTITLCDNLSSNTLRNFDFEEEVYDFVILLKVPSHKKSKYFFTIDGQMYLDENCPKTTLKKDSKIIKFETFNPFREVIISKAQVFLKKSQGVQAQSHETNSKLKDFLQRLPKSMDVSLQFQQSLSFCLKIQEMNVCIPQITNKDQMNNIRCLNKLEKIYQKLISGQEQLSNEQYEVLLVERTQFQSQQQKGSDKYISSDKLIEENQLLNYSTEIHNDQFSFLKPRNKDLMFGLSDQSSTASQTYFSQNFKELVILLDKCIKSNLNSSHLVDLENWLSLNKKHSENKNTKKHNGKCQNSFYPSRSQFNSQNIYLKIVHSSQDYHKEKIKINNFTGQIIKIGVFGEESIHKTQKSLHAQPDTESHTNLMNQQISIKLSKISPYVLMQYCMLKEQSDLQNRSSLKKQDIFSQINEKIKSMRKRKQSKNKERSSRAISKNTTNQPQYKINIKTPQKSQKSLKPKNQGKSKKIITPNKFQIDLKQSGTDENLSAISIRVVQQILNSKRSQNKHLNYQQKDSKQLILQKDVQPQLCLIQKLQSWKAHNHLMDFDAEQKHILKLVSQEIQSSFEKNSWKQSLSQKSSTSKSKKFNLKVNKFCSLQSTTVNMSDIKPLNDLITQRKRPTLNADGIKQKFSTEDKGLDSNLQRGLSFNNQQLRTNQNAFLRKNQIKGISLPDKLNRINISKEIELFFCFESIFDKTFTQLGLQDNIENYIKKIDKFLSKIQRTNKSQWINQNKIPNNSFDTNKKTSQNPSMDQTAKQLKKVTTKSIVKKSLKNEESSEILLKNEKNLIKNVLLFLKSEKENSFKYFSSNQTVRSFPFKQNHIETKKTNFVQIILNRFDYINFNLVKSLSCFKSLRVTLSPGSQQILLKQLYLYRSFLFNSSTLEYSQNTQKFIDAFKKDAEVIQGCSSGFLFKVKRYSFTKIIDLLEQHLLYTIFFLTKHVCFIAFSQSVKNSPKNDLQKKSQSSSPSENLQKDSQKMNQNKLSKVSSKVQNSQKVPESQNLREEPNTFKEQGKFTDLILSHMKNEAQKSEQKIKKLAKSVISQILVIITKLHNKYDEDIQKSTDSVRSSQKSSVKTIKTIQRTPEKLKRNPPTSNFLQNRSTRVVSIQKSVSRNKIQNKSKDLKKLNLDSNSKNQNLVSKSKNKSKLSLLKKAKFSSDQSKANN